jgi:hypothetical protein
MGVSVGSLRSLKTKPLQKPETPNKGKLTLYVRNGRLYVMDHTGAECCLGERSSIKAVSLQEQFELFELGRNLLEAARKNNCV